MILLDTHIWIWFHTEAARLPVSLINSLEQPETSVAISSISIWEVMVAIEKGRIVANQSSDGLVRAWLAAAPIEVLPVDQEIAILSRTLQFAHEDPADRFIAATTIHHKAELCTVDKHLTQLTWLPVFN